MRKVILLQNQIRSCGGSAVEVCIVAKRFNGACDANVKSEIVAGHCHIGYIRRGRGPRTARLNSNVVTCRCRIRDSQHRRTRT